MFRRYCFPGGSVLLIVSLYCATIQAQDFKIYNPPNFLLPMFPDQQYSDYPEGSTYLVAHVAIDQPVQIRTVTTYFSATHPWPLGTIEAILNIVSEDGDMPAEDHDPRGPSQGGEGVVVLSELYAVGPKYAVEANLLENGILTVLPAGEYWFGLTPKIDESVGQEYHIASDFFDRNAATRNPGGDLGFGTDWFEAGPVYAGTDWGMAIRIIGQSTPCEFLLGDVNRDGAVNLLDVGPFVEILTSGETPCEADINQDGVVNLVDVNPLVELLVGS